MDTFEKLSLILNDEFSLDTGKFSKETTFSELGFDSLDLADAVMATEENFKIEIPDEVFKDMETLGDVCEYIESHI